MLPTVFGHVHIWEYLIRGLAVKNSPYLGAPKKVEPGPEFSCVHVGASNSRRCGQQVPPRGVLWKTVPDGALRS